MNASDRARESAGTPAGGRFRAETGARAEIALSNPASTSTPVPAFERSLVAAFGSAEAAKSSHDLAPYVSHPDPLVRAEAAINPHLDDDQVGSLVADDDWLVRWTIAQRRDVDAWRSLVNDPDPRVRLVVAFEADEPTRQRILADPAVHRIVQATQPPA